MGQYRPEHKVDSSARYADIARHPTRDETKAANAAARAAGLHRLDERR